MIKDTTQDGYITIKKMHKVTEYELWHQRLMHPGQVCMKYIDKCTKGVPSLTRNSLHQCKICDQMNIKKHTNKASEDSPIFRFGDRFQMDFGFMSAKTDNRIIRSYEGYNCYLLIIESFTRYTWVFLSKNKSPPLKTINQFLCTYGNTDGIRVIRTDQGGELAKSASFRETVQLADYTIETTGADNSSQNGLAERPHQTLANMVRTGLENAGLHFKFWSDALLHAVFVKNRLPHQAFNHKCTPYEKLTGTPPDLSKLRIFGSRVVCRKPGRRSPKISKHSYSGIFLRYSKTMKNIVYLDTKTNKTKTSTFAQFDEAHFSYENKPPGAKILIELGIQEMDKKPMKDSNEYPLQILKQHLNATIPTRGSEQAAGYDLYSIKTYDIPSSNIGLVDTGISTKFPPGTYGRIASRSGLVINNFITVLGGVIDPDYTGNLKVLLYNFGTTPFQVKPGDRVAQLILEQYKVPPVITTDKISSTDRGAKGFGSTGLGNESSKDTTKILTTYTSTDKSHSTAATIDMTFTTPIFTTTVIIQNRGNHPTLGLQLQNDDRGPKIMNCLHGTPAAKIPKWRQTLKHSILYAINDVTLTSLSDVKQIMATCNDTSLNLHVISPTPVDIHPDTGVPQLNFDQFTHVANIHQDIIHEKNNNITQLESDDDTQVTINKLAKNTFTRTELLKRSDWKEWEKAEALQMDQYVRQNMFGKPGPLPQDKSNLSVLPMIWVYLIKVDGRRKARCVANGAAHFQGTVTLSQTYATCIDQSACRLFWAIAAIKGKLVFGSDAIKAFAEAPPPKCPLYLRVDIAYRHWYKNKYNISLPSDSYVQVHHAIQGHPESPRLWQLHIDNILKKIGFQATTHEPCIYVLYTQTETIYMLRQVDDFAIACDKQSTAIHYWDCLDKYLKEPLKREKGLMTRHNGIDIVQTQDAITLHCATYLKKIMSSKTFDMTLPKDKPIPMLSDNAYMRMLESTKGPQDTETKRSFEHTNGFKYRNATGELIFAMIICRPDISFPVLKLSQFNNSHAQCHADAIKVVYRYLNATKEEGITFWRPAPVNDLPYTPRPDIHDSNYTVFIPPENGLAQTMYCYTDSDWANNSTTRKSVSGTCIMLGGGAIIYKTIVQRTVALSTTEAEFYSLTDAGKLVLYVRLVLADLNIEQKNATKIYEDNRGCLQMAQALKPTRRTRHVEAKYFAILDWVQTDQIEITKINTADNASDVLTKATGKILFYRHNATIMGKRVPSYVLHTAECTGLNRV